MVEIIMFDNIEYGYVDGIGFVSVFYTNDCRYSINWSLGFSGVLNLIDMRSNNFKLYQSF